MKLLRNVLAVTAVLSALAWIAVIVMKVLNVAPFSSGQDPHGYNALFIIIGLSFGFLVLGVFSLFCARKNN